MSNLFNKPKKTSPLNLQDLFIIKSVSGKIMTIEGAQLLNQILDLGNLGQGCMTYPETTITDCETGEEVTLPLQITDVLTEFETQICALISGGFGNASQLGGEDPSYYLEWANILNIPASFTPSAHTHDWSEITGKPFTVCSGRVIVNGGVITETIYENTTGITPVFGYSSNTLQITLTGLNATKPYIQTTVAYNPNDGSQRTVASIGSTQVFNINFYDSAGTLLTSSPTGQIECYFEIRSYA